MTIEVWGMAQEHVASELSAESECRDMTMHSDGTAKFGHSYSTFDLKNMMGICLLSGWGKLVGRCSVTTGPVPENTSKCLWFFRK